MLARFQFIFQPEIDKIFQGMKAVCYLIDVLVYGENEEKHLQNLNAVLTRLEEAGMKLHLDNCKFLKPSIEYLGHRIDHQGLHPVESKIEAQLSRPQIPKIELICFSLSVLVVIVLSYYPTCLLFLATLYELLKNIIA